MTGFFKYKVLNIILFALVLSTAFMNYETWSQPNESPKAAAQKPGTKPEGASKTEAPAVKESPKPDLSYKVIAEKNIFNPDRKDFPSPALLAAEQPKPVLRPQVVLSGVIISDNYQAASVSIPGRPLRKGERDAMTLKLGSNIGAYKLAKIADDRITLEAGGDSFEVLLYDPKKAKARVEVRMAESKAPEVRSTQPAPAFDTATYQAVRKPVEKAQGMVIAAALPALEENPLYYSRQARAKRYAELNRRAENQKGTETVYSKTGKHG